jgi:hypothetical protein
MSTPSAPDSPSTIIATLAEQLGHEHAFGPPVHNGGVTLVPVAAVRAGGGLRPRARSGAGMVTRPVGAFSIAADGTVAWHPAVDVDRIVLGGQLLVGVVLAVALGLRRR